MAKLNKNDHKHNDIGAKIVRGIGLTILTIGAMFVGSKIKDANSNKNEDDEQDQEA